MKNLLVIVLIAAFLGGVVYLKNTQGVDKNKLKTDILPKTLQKLVAPGTKYTIGDLKETSGVYEVSLTLGQGANSKTFTSYVTKDGKIFFVSALKIDDLNKQPPKQEVKGTKKVSCSDIKKTDKPVLTAFIVSNCPYGLQMQRILKKAISELPQIEQNLQIRYIGSIDGGKITSMHGDKEAQENLRQICIREEQKDKYWNYVSCFMQEGKSDSCLTSTGIEINSLNSCMTDPNRGLQYAKADFDLANKHGISSSPTLLLNDLQTVSEFDFGGRNPNAIKEIVACSFKTKPDVFNKELSKTDVATSFSQTDEAAKNAGSSASCGTQ